MQRGSWAGEAATGRSISGGVVKRTLGHRAVDERAHDTVAEECRMTARAQGLDIRISYHGMGREEFPGRFALP
jgi:hypothetical protein